MMAPDRVLACLLVLVQVQLRQVSAEGKTKFTKFYVVQYPRHSPTLSTPYLYRSQVQWSAVVCSSEL